MRTLGPLLSNVWLRDGPLRLFEFRPRERLEPWFCLMTSVYAEVIHCPNNKTSLQSIWIEGRTSFKGQYSEDYVPHGIYRRSFFTTHQTFNTKGLLLDSRTFSLLTRMSPVAGAAMCRPNLF